MALPGVYRSEYRRVNPPTAFFEFNQSARNKLLRCAQNYHYPIEPTPVTDSYIQFFNVLSDQSNCWNIQTQFAASQSAARALPPMANGNISAESFAAAQCIYAGWAQKHPIPNTRTFMYRLDIRSQHAIADIVGSTTFQERVNFACLAALKAYQTLPAKRMRPQDFLAAIQKEALTTLHYRDQVWISATSEYTKYLRGVVTDFIEGTIVNALKLGDFDPTIDYPQVEEPEDRRISGQITIRWDEFVFEGTPKYLAPRAANNIANTAAEVLGDFSEGDILTTTDLLELGLARNQITNWVKYGILKLSHKIGRENAYFLYGPPPRQVKNIFKSEPISLESMNMRVTRKLSLEELRIRTAEAANPDAVKYNMMVMETQAGGKKIRDEYLKPGGISTVAAPTPDIKPTTPKFKPKVPPRANPKRPKFQPKIAKKGAD